MASNVSEEESKIPVFTVLKNNAIFKNIFILNKSPQPSPSKKPNSSSVVVKDHENVLVVGRHPDCDIMLTHPSISRFHLQIRSKPSSQSISIIDLSSVHGTWVSEKKVEPGVSVEMKEGDTLRIGASSRVYRLHWIPVSRTYDLDEPFVSELDVVLEAQNEEQEQVQNLKCCPDEIEEIQLEDSILECIKLLFLDENLEVTVEKDIAAAPPMPEDTFSFCCPEDRKSPSKDGVFGFLSEPCGTGTSYLPTTSDWEKELCDSLNQELSVKMEIPMLEGVISFCCEEEMSQSKDKMFGIPNDPLGAKNGLRDSLNQVLALPYVESSVECIRTLTEYLSESICLPVVEAVQGTKMQQFHTTLDKFTSSLPPDPATFDGKCAAGAVIPEESECGYMLRDDEQVRDRTAAAEFFNSENTFLQVEEVVCNTTCQNKVVEEIAIDSLCDGKKQDTRGEEHKSELSHLNAKYCSLDESVQDIGNNCTDSICPISNQIESVNSSTPQKAVLKITKEDLLPQTDIEFLESSGESMEQKSTIGNIWSRRGKVASAPQIRTSKSTFKSKDSVDIKVTMSNVKDIPKTDSEDCFSVLDDGQEEEEIFTPDKENFSPNTLQLRFLKKKGKLEKTKRSKSKRSRNSKDTCSPNFYPNGSIISNPSKENQMDIISKTVSRDLFSHFDGEEEIFTPDKENFSPNTHQLWTLKKNGKLKETKFSEWSQKSKENFSPNIYPDERISSTSNKENQTLKVVQEQKSRRKPFGSHIKMAQEQGVMASNRVERVPFQVLNPFGSHIKMAQEQGVMASKRVEKVPFQVLNNPGGKSKSRTSCHVSATKSKSRTSCHVSATKSIGISDSGQILDKRVNFSQDITGEQKKSWDMVVDTASLMNRESRKALQLLQGLKGTRLIIPRLVVGELNRMKQQFSFFRRISEASLALEWIEECMVKTNWWIHIQSSMEVESMVAPTPPAFPYTQFSLQSLSFRRSSGEVASPTVEDDILDFVKYRRKQNDGQLVQLSEDVTLKIKCMAEGLLCESVQVFRESLVNPFSERFLWANSSPRGQTWSCQDDVVLREKYCPFLSKKSSKGAASGLKLILLHNSQYNEH
ncbi:PREDICTED: FHA domain-containing protein PS1-like isoform X5 [Lupinus angustifolius]|uniref:FHA domain-containing protein PS1-like isoform X4 n=1 Tax=Lupinus angustifolius TaxID=3871 RepID=UPI00092FD5C5|nr:PREDICTED: FHA domain-containing protein PS1-like isoform X4 [Lupinus angustifolius]XP_019413472.1 PREDICTED: FHA domain-containing protein PS1-like isoform X5 [Lupinus angustifolius]